MKESMSRITYYNKCRRSKIAYLGGKCVKCGTTEKLEFDHIDPSTKSFCVSKYMQSFTPKVMAELDKCQLLCKEHHKEKAFLRVLYMLKNKFTALPACMTIINVDVNYAKKHSDLK